MTATLVAPSRRTATSSGTHPPFYCIEPTSIGPMLVVSSAQRLRAIEFADSEDQLQSRAAQRYGDASPGCSEWIEAAIAALVQHIDLTLPLGRLPLDIQGTPFQRRVWQSLMELPLGCTISYSELARMIGQPTATRAVASACAANKLAIAIPCHRVLRRDGQLGGYRWGVERKRTLLERERRAAGFHGQSMLL